MSPAESAGDRKRRRIAIACDECRDRKRKCDGVKPVCGACAKRRSPQCVWDEGRNAKGWNHSYVESLRDRIQELEEGQAMANTQRFGHPSACQPGRSAAPLGLPTRQLLADETDGLGLRTPQQSMTSPEMVALSEATSMPARSIDELPSYATARGYADAVPSEMLDSGSVAEEDASDDESAIDAMGVFGSFDDRERQGSGFFGPSSTISFLSHARRAMGQHESGPGAYPSKSGLPGILRHEGIGIRGRSLSSVRITSKPSISQAEYQFSIPPRQKADALLDSYWTYVHSLYPYLHRPSFTKKYLTLWSAAQDFPSSMASKPPQSQGYYANIDERLFHCLLNLAFALGSQFGPTTEDGDRSQLGLTFFGRAKALMDFDLFVQGNIFLVQMLILMGHYLQSTDMASACWTMVGLAIRTAQGIGLHHEPEHCDQGCCSKMALSQLETEMRRRAWSGCILLDRVCSMTFGRPLMIHPAISQRCVPPSAIDDGRLAQDPGSPAVQPADVPSVTEFYVRSIQLQNILGEILDALYYGSSDKGSGKLDVSFNFIAASTARDKLNDGGLQVLLSLDKSLSSWCQSLPAHLKAQNYNFTASESGRPFGPDTPTFNRQAIILHARYLHVRLFMFRLVLSAALFHSSSQDAASEPHHSMESAMRQDILDKGVNLCVSSAYDLVELITANLHVHNDILPPSWHNVFYVHSCAIVFLICHLCCPSRIRDESVLTTGWNKCLSFFRSYRLRSRSAKRCLRIMEAVRGDPFPSQDHTHPVNLRDDPSNWRQDGLLQHGAEYSRQPFGQDILADQTAASWISDPTEINWLSIFPFVEGQEDEYSGLGEMGLEPSAM
ncbi:fungal-specific transcription factor domain-containing protein [Aspergillus bertholletiae]|uniref:Fungal-specific transcription factor domain-containing protein n=1 Tax=Aspergillus bertholletiae TaxID=1226010 RepID=A0A5N7BD95_9EURO|nr:fungal-specific transcription factor domain-containing protein [Aspergillus bertholletiae]